jgi:uncharacterized protein (DUF2336 family)
MVKSSAYSPLDSLVDLACRDGVDIRPTLLRVVTDLYVQKPEHTSEEETQYVELALGLIGAVDEQTRAALAARLSGYPKAPRAVLERLTASCAEPPAAPPMASPVAPAQEAPAASPPPSAPANDLIELFFTASAEERRLILINLDVVAEPAPQRQAPPAEAVIRRLESTALQRNVTEFARMLERGLSVSRELATRIVHDTSGECIVVAAKALGVKADVHQRILLFLNPAIGQSVERVFELAQLYDDITSNAAKHMVAIWRQKSERLRPRHAPMLWDDERSNARTRATPAPHRGLRTGESEPPLHRSGTRQPR